MPDITRIQIADEPERKYNDFPANREFKKRAEDENSGSSSNPSYGDIQKDYTISLSQITANNYYMYEEASFVIREGEEYVINIDGVSEKMTCVKGWESVSETQLVVRNYDPNEYDPEYSEYPNKIMFEASSYVNKSNGEIRSGWEVRNYTDLTADSLVVNLDRIIKLDPKYVDGLRYVTVLDNEGKESSKYVEIKSADTIRFGDLSYQNRIVYDNNNSLHIGGGLPLFNNFSINNITLPSDGNSITGTIRARMYHPENQNVIYSATINTRKNPWGRTAQVSLSAQHNYQPIDSSTELYGRYRLESVVLIGSWWDGSNWTNTNGIAMKTMYYIRIVGTNLPNNYSTYETGTYQYTITRRDELA